MDGLFNGIGQARGVMLQKGRRNAEVWVAVEGVADDLPDSHRFGVKTVLEPEADRIRFEKLIDLGYLEYKIDGEAIEKIPLVSP